MLNEPADDSIIDMDDADNFANSVKQDTKKKVKKVPEKKEIGP